MQGTETATDPAITWSFVKMSPVVVDDHPRAFVDTRLSAPEDRPRRSCCGDRHDRVEGFCGDVGNRVSSTRAPDQAPRGQLSPGPLQATGGVPNSYDSASDEASCETCESYEDIDTGDGPWWCLGL